MQIVGNFKMQDQDNKSSQLDVCKESYASFSFVTIIWDPLQ